MALRENTLLGQKDKVQLAIDRLKTFEPEEGYYMAFSGGKDSQCIYHLAKMANVKFDAHYSVTTVDPPELMRFIKEYYPDVKWEYPVGKDGKRTSMWKLIEEHTVPPTRQIRYCCDVLKEQGGIGRVCVTGVRWDESVRRRDLHGIVDIRTSSKKLINDTLENNEAARVNKTGSLIFIDDNEETRKQVEFCYQKRRTTVNPIVDWLDEDVWEFLNDVAKVSHCCLYDEGFDRLGCIGCPLQGREGMLRDFERWPRYKELYIRAFDKMIETHKDEIRVVNNYEASGGELRGGQSCFNGGQPKEQWSNDKLARVDAEADRGSSAILDESLLNVDDIWDIDKDKGGQNNSHGGWRCTDKRSVQGVSALDRFSWLSNDDANIMFQWWLYIHR